MRGLANGARPQERPRLRRRRRLDVVGVRRWAEGRGDAGGVAGGVAGGKARGKARGCRIGDLVGLVLVRARRSRRGVELGRGVPCRRLPLVEGGTGLIGGALTRAGREGRGGAGGVGGVAGGEARGRRSGRDGGRPAGLVQMPYW